MANVTVKSERATRVRLAWDSTAGTREDWRIVHGPNEFSRDPMIFTENQSFFTGPNG